MSGNSNSNAIPYNAPSSPPTFYCSHCNGRCIGNCTCIHYNGSCELGIKASQNGFDGKKMALTLGRRSGHCDNHEHTLGGCVECQYDENGMILSARCRHCLMDITRGIVNKHNAHCAYFQNEKEIQIPVAHPYGKCPLKEDPNHRCVTTTVATAAVVSNQSKPIKRKSDAIDSDDVDKQYIQNVKRAAHELQSAISCAVCQKEMRDPVWAGCKIHSFCIECWFSVVTTCSEYKFDENCSQVCVSNVKCPVCRKVAPTAHGLEEIIEQLFCNFVPAHIHQAMSRLVNLAIKSPTSFGCNNEENGFSDDEEDDDDVKVIGIKWKPFSLKLAREYVDRIESRLGQKSNQFQALLKSLSQFNQGKIDRSHLIEKIKILLHRHTDLLEEFLAWAARDSSADQKEEDKQEQFANVESEEAYCQFCNSKWTTLFGESVQKKPEPHYWNEFKTKFPQTAASLNPRQIHLIQCVIWQLPCANKAQGCKDYMFRSPLHISNCRYFQCQFSPCSATGLSQSEVIQHHRVHERETKRFETNCTPTELGLFNSIHQLFGYHRFVGTGFDAIEFLESTLSELTRVAQQHALAQRNTQIQDWLPTVMDNLATIKRSVQSTAPSSLFNSDHIMRSLLMSQRSGIRR